MSKAQVDKAGKQLGKRLGRDDEAAPTDKVSKAGGSALVTKGEHKKKKLSVKSIKGKLTKATLLIKDAFGEDEDGLAAGDTLAYSSSSEPTSLTLTVLTPNSKSLYAVFVKLG